MYLESGFEIKIIFILLIGSFLIKRAIIFADQTWVKTFSNTATIYFLPIIVHFITKAISGNIALSLGMIGALSIVRFRNPVKSPFELVIFFLLITLGITSSVNDILPIILTIISTIILIMIKLFNLFNKKFRKENIYSQSFDEADLTNTLEIKSTKTIEELMTNQLLKGYSFYENCHIYRLSSSNKEYLEKIVRKYENENFILFINYNKN
tara:strand:+ start:141 stop:770 length:630 start_codon:yes stop_codon:yes gene_type:complete